MAQARFSIRTAVAEGFEFWRAHWSKAAGPLGLAAVAKLMIAAGDPGLLVLGYGLELVALSMVGAVYYRIALADLGAEPASVNRPLGLQWGKLEGKLVAANLLIMLIYTVVLIVCVFMLIVFLSGASQEAPIPQVDHVVTPDELMKLLTPQQLTALFVASGASMVVCLLVWARLAMAGPATAARGAVSVLSTLPLTRGATLRLAGLWLMVQLPIFLLQLVAVQIGLALGDATMALVGNLTVQLIGVFFATPILIGALAYTYRRLAPEPVI